MNAARSDGPRYRLQGFTTPDTSRGYDAENEADTLAEARRKARHMLSREWQRLTESAGPLSLIVIVRADGAEIERRYRDPDPVLVEYAAPLHKRAIGPGLYADPRIDGVARFDRVEVALGYPRDRIVMRDAYGPEDVGSQRWVTLTPDACLFNQRGETVINPLHTYPSASPHP